MPFSIIRSNSDKIRVDAVVAVENGKDCSYTINTKKNFFSKLIINVVSPTNIDENFEENLRSCYCDILKIAYENKCKAISIPLIYETNRYISKEEEIRIILDVINELILDNKMMIYILVGKDVSSREEDVYSNLRKYIENNYEIRQLNVLKTAGRSVCNKSTYARENYDDCIGNIVCDECGEYDYGEYDYGEYEGALKERMKHISDTFAQYLLFLIDKKGLTSAQVYKNAIVTKQLFSKIKLNPNYHPDKSTAMRLCIGARLNIDETKDLLGRAGYALSPCDKRDIIFSFFIENSIYDMIEIDIILEEYGLPCFIE